MRSGLLVNLAQKLPAPSLPGGGQHCHPHQALVPPFRVDPTVYDSMNEEWCHRWHPTFSSCYWKLKGARSNSLFDEEMWFHSFNPRSSSSSASSSSSSSWKVSQGTCIFLQFWLPIHYDFKNSKKQFQSCWKPAGRATPIIFVQYLQLLSTLNAAPKDSNARLWASWIRRTDLVGSWSRDSSISLHHWIYRRFAVWL